MSNEHVILTMPDLDLLDVKTHAVRLRTHGGDVLELDFENEYGARLFIELIPAMQLSGVLLHVRSAIYVGPNGGASTITLN